MRWRMEVRGNRHGKHDQGNECGDGMDDQNGRKRASRLAREVEVGVLVGQRGGYRVWRSAGSRRNQQGQGLVRNLTQAFVVANLYGATSRIVVDAIPKNTKRHADVLAKRDGFDDGCRQDRNQQQAKCRGEQNRQRRSRP